MRLPTLIALCAAALSVVAASVAEAAAGGPGNPFTVANYPVDAVAKDAVAAKEKAHADGQQAAFRALLKRLVPVTAYDRLGRLKQVNAAGLVQGVAVRREQNSSTQYTASLDFAFDPVRVQDLLAREGVPFAGTQAPPAVIVPVIREEGGQKVDPRVQTLWTDIWRELDLENSISPLKLEAPRPVLDAALLKKLAGGSGEADRILSGEYGGKPVVVAAARLDTTGKRLHVRFDGRDAVGRLALERSYRITDGDVAYAMELAAVVALGTVEGRWKTLPAASARTGGR